MLKMIDRLGIGGTRGRIACAALLVLASPAPLLASNKLPDATIHVDLKHIDLSSAKGRIARDYRIGAEAAAACESDAGQSPSQFKACVHLAVKAGRRQCTQAEQICRVAIDRHAKICRPPRPSFGPRHMS